MPWTWRYETAAGTAPPGPDSSQEFPTQADAETWIGESWQELLDGGIDQVRLLEDERVAYGPMSLHPES
jgi:hypothetical protein